MGTPEYGDATPASVGPATPAAPDPGGSTPSTVHCAATTGGRSTPRHPAATTTPALLAGTAVTITATLLLLWPALGRGVLLYRDFVTVPQPRLGPRALATDGRAPRAVPLDAITAALAPVIPAGAQQQLMLLVSLALAGLGMTVLLRRWGPVATASAAAVTIWSPYAGERLLLGQPPTLLGWAMVPWLIVATRAQGPVWRRVGLVALAAAPAALTPFGSVLALAVVAVVALADRQRHAELLALAALAVAWCLPWAIPALRGATEAGQRDGAPAFAVATGSVTNALDVLTGGGIWSPGATLDSRATATALTASLLLGAIALVGILTAGRRRTRPTLRPTDRGLLLAALVVPPVVALLLAGPLAGAWAAAQSLPGAAILRDTHRLLGLTTLASAAGVGMAAASLVRRLTPAAAARTTHVLSTTATPSARGSGARVAMGAGTVVTITALAVLTAPDLPARLHNAYRPVAMPAAWQQAVDAVGDRTTLILPWQPFRQTGWAGPHPFLDPVPLALRGRAVSATDLVVERGGRSLRVGQEDPPATRQWRAGQLDPADLAAYGIEAVIEWKDTPGTLPTEHPGLTQALDTTTLRVWMVDRK